MTKLEQKVMAGVAVIYVARLLVSRRAFKAYALFLSFCGIVFFASVPDVVENFVHVTNAGAPAIGTFFISAITKTSLIVQVAVVLGVVGLLSLTRDMVRAPSDRRFA